MDIWNYFFLIFSSKRYLEYWTKHFLFPLKAATAMIIDNISLKNPTET